MYFVVIDKKSISMRPCDLGPFFHQRLEEWLRRELEGSLSKNHDGTIVHIFRITDKSKPRIQDGTGYAVVDVKFEVCACVCFCAYVFRRQSCFDRFEMRLLIVLCRK